MSKPSNFFDVSKRNALHKLDKSPKGSLDVPIAALVYGLNAHPDFVTTSCCSGRIVLFAANGTRGGRWLLVRHGPVDVAAVESALRGSPSFDSPESGGGAVAHGGTPEPSGSGAMGSGIASSPAKLNGGSTASKNAISATDAPPSALKGVVSLKVEPAILHVQCRDTDAAKRLLQVAKRANYHESGIVLSESGKVMLAIRTTSYGLEMPLALTSNDGAGTITGVDPSAACDLTRLVSDEFLAFAVGHANDKFASTQERLAALEALFGQMAQADAERRRGARDGASPDAAMQAVCGDCQQENEAKGRQSDDTRSKRKGGGRRDRAAAIAAETAQASVGNLRAPPAAGALPTVTTNMDAAPPATSSTSSTSSMDAAPPATMAGDEEDDDKDSSRDSSQDSSRDSSQDSTLRLAAGACAARSAPLHFLNLTNGIEALPGLTSLVSAVGIPFEALRFCRIQSSHCEARDYYGVLESIDAEMLLLLALGYTVRVYDFGSRAKRWPGYGIGRLGEGRSSTSDAVGDSHKGSGGNDPAGGSTGERPALFVPSAIWWGLEWVRYALSRIWHLPTIPVVRMHGHDSKTSSLDLERALERMPRPVKRRLKYYRTYVATQTLRLEGIFAPTRLDGQREEYARRLWRGYVLRDMPSTAGIAHSVTEGVAVEGDPTASSKPSAIAARKAQMEAPTWGAEAVPPAASPPLPDGMMRFDGDAFAY